MTFSRVIVLSAVTLSCSQLYIFSTPATCLLSLMSGEEVKAHAAGRTAFRVFKSSGLTGT